MTNITVVHDAGNVFTVTVEEGWSSTSHQVTVWPSDVERYAPGTTPEELLEASFRFLLEREPKQAILRRFELAVIERYFPDYPAVIASRLTR